MNRYFKRLGALISASLASNTNALVIQSNDVIDEDESPMSVSLLNTNVDPILAQHRSHSSHGSHGSHGSHRSSAGGGIRSVPIPTPPPAPAPRPAPTPPRSSDPLGQDPRPPQSTPPPETPRSIEDLDQEALRNIVMRMQLTLQFEGYYEGEIDGIMGPETRAAVLRYKRDNDIPGNTIFDAETLNAFGIVGL